MTTPTRTTACSWPVETGCCAGWEQFPEPVRVLAEAVAVELLWVLSGRRFGTCPIALRPCRRGCAHTAAPPYGAAWPPPVWSTPPPDGLWFDPCRCADRTDCGCRRLSEVDLPGPVHRVTEVRVDGAVLTADAYRVDNHRLLVRTDGQYWPRCQDLAAPPTQPGTFAVAYERGVPVPAGGRAAAGVYAYEVAKACTEQKCRLPRRVAAVARQGVDVQYLDPTALANDGLTGLPEVDGWLRAVNPHRLPRDAVVYSPDLARGRRHTS